MKLQEWQKGYIAGMIDGDGCITIRRYNPKYSKSYHVDIRITNIDKTMIDYLKFLIPEGKVYTTERANKRHQTSYLFAIFKHAVIIELLEQIASMMIIKKEKALLVIEMCKRRQKIQSEIRPKGKDGKFVKSKRDPISEQIYQSFRRLC